MQNPLFLKNRSPYMTKISILPRSTLCIFYTFLIWATISFLVGCSIFNPESRSSSQPIIKLEIVNINNSIANGTQTHFTATGIDDQGKLFDLSDQVAWSSSDDNVLAPIANQPGTFTAIGLGNTLVNASYQSLATTTPLTVTNATLVKLAISPSERSLPSGFTRQLKVIGIFSDNTKQVLNDATWSVSKPNIASIEQTGLITTLKAGEVNITAHSALNKDISHTLSIEVTAATLSSIKLTLANKTKSLPQGTRTEIMAMGIFSDGSHHDVSQAITWLSSDETVLKIKTEYTTPIVSTLSEGSATISALLSGISANASITVNAIEITKIFIDIATPKTPNGVSVFIAATGIFSDGSKKNLSLDVYWFTSDESIATISNALGASRGRITPKLPGKITLTAFYSGIKTELSFEVTDATFQDLNLFTNKTTIPVGIETQFFAHGIFSDGSQLDFTDKVVWNSSDENIAYIRNTQTGTGIVQALVPGEVKIKASYNNISAATTLTVSDPNIATLEIQPSILELAKGTQAEIIVTGIFSNGDKLNLTNFVVFTSSNSNVNILDNTNTYVYATTEGGSTITASYQDVSIDLEVTVNNAVLEKLEIFAASLQIPVTRKMQLSATGIFSDGSKQDLSKVVSWTSSDSSVANISNVDSTAGILQGVRGGQVLITASINGLSANTLVELQQVDLVRIQLIATQLLAAGLSAPIRAMGTFSDGSTADITTQVSWISSNPQAIIITPNTSHGTAAFITAVSGGTSTITAQLNGIFHAIDISATMATIQALEISPSNLSLPIGITQLLTATATLSDDTTKDVTKDVTWTSDAESVASIANAYATSGSLIGLTNGLANIKAQLNGVEKTIGINIINPALQKIEITPGIILLAKGLSLKLQATGQYSDNSTQNITQNVTWSTDNTNVIAISNAPQSLGMLFALNSGSATIIASLSGVTHSLNAVITDAILNGISIESDNANIPAGTQTQLTATGNYSDGSEQDLTSLVAWSTGDPSIANIDNTNARLLALAEGITFISANYAGITGTQFVNISSATLTSLTFDIVNATVANLTGIQIKAIGSFSDASQKDLTQESIWASSAPHVAQANNNISMQGWIDALSPGVTSISATYNDTSIQTTLTVSDAELQSIAITSAVDTFAKGTQNPLQAIGNYTGNLQQSLTHFVNWTVDDASIATISNATESKGIVSGLQTGNVNVSASFGSQTSIASFTIVDDPTLAVGLAFAAIPNVILNNGADQTSLHFFVRAADIDSRVADTTELAIELIEGQASFASNVTTQNGQATILLSSTFAGIIKLKISVIGTTITRNIYLYSTDDLATTIGAWISVKPILDGNILKTGSQILFTIANGVLRSYSLIAFSIYNDSELLQTFDIANSDIDESRKFLTPGKTTSAYYKTPKDIIEPKLALIYELRDDASGSTFEYRVNIGF